MSQQPHPSPSTSEHYTELPTWARLLSGSVAVVFLIVAGLILYYPPISVTVKQDGQGQVTERTTSSTSDSAAAIAVFGTAVGLLFFALNGLRLVRFSAGGFEAESGTVSDVVKNVKTDEEMARLPDSKKQPITDDDVAAAFAKIPDFSGVFSDVDLARMSSGLRLNLLFNGIATKGQLEELVSSTGILNTLRSLYIRVLRRDPNKPLDPVAVVVWGSALYRLGLNDDVVRAIEVRLRESPEYREKVATGIIKP